MNFLLRDSLWWNVPAFLVVSPEVITLIMIVRKAVSLHGTGISIDRRICIFVKDGSLLV